MSKLLLIDGHSILNRAFYGVPVFNNSKGVYTNAVYGFLNIMFKMTDDTTPDKIVVAFDEHAPTFRHKMYDKYKGTRKKMPEELLSQVPVIKDVLKSMNIDVISKEGFEADDILGTLSVKAEENGMDVVILSGDRDLLQLATDKTFICIPKTSKGVTTYNFYDAAKVLEEKKVTPKEFIDVKAIWGDTSDNIPGVEGIGEVGATNIIAQFHSIENAFEHLDEISNTRNRNAFEKGYESAKLSKTLATIDTDAPVEIDFDAHNYELMFNDKSFEMFKDLELKSLMSRFQSEFGQKKAEISYERIEDLNSFKDKLLSFKDEGVGISFVNASELGAHENDNNSIKAVAFSCGIDKNYAFLAEDDNALDEVCSILRELVKDGFRFYINSIKKYNDLLMADKNSNIFDVSLASYILNYRFKDYDFIELSIELLDINIDNIDSIFPDKIKRLRKITDEGLVKYSCNEALVMFLAGNVLKDKLTGDEKKLYEDMELPLSYVLYDMEKEGVRIDKESLKSFGEQLQSEIEVIEKSIYDQAGGEFNINSPKQLGEILFEKMELKGGKKTKTGYSTSAQELEKLSKKVPFVSDVLTYRQLTKLHSTYTDGLAKFISDDGRIHGKFNQTITATGRLSSTDPNLQNIPIRTEKGRMIRKAFIPKDGYVFVDADYSQIELRILAHLSGDTNMIAAFSHDEDIHTSTAARVFKIDKDEVTPNMRRAAKAVNFGIVYGMSSFGLSEELSISRAQATSYINDYFDSYPDIKKYLDLSVEKAKNDGYTETMFGRKRLLPEIKSSNFMQRQFGERVAMNAPIQGTAADIIKIAMINVYNELKNRNLKSKLILQVHDELLIETALDEVEEVKQLLSDQMSKAANLLVPLKVSVEIGDNWDEAH